jgi:hypothetical protein
MKAAPTIDCETVPTFFEKALEQYIVIFCLFFFTRTSFFAQSSPSFPLILYHKKGVLPSHLIPLTINFFSSILFVGTVSVKGGKNSPLTLFCPLKKEAFQYSSVFLVL